MGRVLTTGLLGKSLSLTSLSMILSSWIHVAANGIIWYGWVVFHRICIHLYPAICRWSLGWFPCLGYCEQCCCEHGGVCTLKDSWIWVNSQEWRCWSSYFVLQRGARPPRLAAALGSGPAAGRAAASLGRSECCLAHGSLGSVVKHARRHWWAVGRLPAGFLWLESVLPGVWGAPGEKHNAALSGAFSSRLQNPSAIPHCMGHLGNSSYTKAGCSYPSLEQQIGNLPSSCWELGYEGPLSTGLPGSDLFLIIQLFEKITNQSSIASCRPLGCLTKLGNSQISMKRKMTLV